jgi:hypothetical protein
MGGLQPAEDIPALTVTGQPQRDVISAPEDTEKVGVRVVGAVVVGRTDHAGPVSVQGHGGQGLLADDDRVHELHGHVLRVGGRTAVAEGEDLPTGGEASAPSRGTCRR